MSQYATRSTATSVYGSRSPAVAPWRNDGSPRLVLACCGFESRHRHPLKTTAEMRWSSERVGLLKSSSQRSSLWSRFYLVKLDQGYTKRVVGK